MKVNYFNTLSDELVLLCMHHLDRESLLNFSLTCLRMNGLAKDAMLCKQLCYADPTANALIEAIGIKQDLEEGKIAPYFFLLNIQLKDYKALWALLSPEKQQVINLWIASYEQPRPRSFFAKTHPEYPHQLFLTQEKASETIKNASKVKAWVKVSVPLDEDRLEQLMRHTFVPYTESIASHQLVAHSPEVGRHFS